MVTSNQALSTIPSGLREPLVIEYNNIVQNYMERRWSPAELSGGKFCEIVYTILEGFLSGSFAPTPQKPKDFVSACRSLETKASSVRSFKILIPRMLPALYEIRNNRGVGHAGGDVDPNHMDATAVLSMTSWIMAELVRVVHKLRIDEAQNVVDSLTERRVPLVWQVGEIKRVLNPNLSLKDQILLLLSSVPLEVDVEELFRWTDYKNKSYFLKILRQLHALRFLEFNKGEKKIQILPPGSDYILKLIRELS